MTPLVFSVLRSSGQYAIGYWDQLYGPFEAEQDAVDQAVYWAYHNVRNGRPAEVRLEQDDCRFKTVWVAGDPTPTLADYADAAE